MHIWWKKLDSLQNRQEKQLLILWANCLLTGMRQLRELFFQILGNIFYSMYTGIALSFAWWNTMQEACCWEQKLGLPSLTLSLHRDSSSQSCAWHTAEAEDVTLANANWNGTWFLSLHLRCLDATHRQLANGYHTESNPIPLGPGQQNTRNAKLLKHFTIWYQQITLSGSFILFLMFFSAFQILNLLASFRFLGGFMMASQLLRAVPSMQPMTFCIHRVYTVYWLKQGLHPNFHSCAMGESMSQD